MDHFKKNQLNMFFRECVCFLVANKILNLTPKLEVFQIIAFHDQSLVSLINYSLLGGRYL